MAGAGVVSARPPRLPTSALTANEALSRMCSQGDIPPYDAPTPRQPRTYVLSGSAPERCGDVGPTGARCQLPIGHDTHFERAPEPKPSIALAVLGEMLNDAENALEKRDCGADRVVALREARDRVAEAEAKA